MNTTEKVKLEQCYLGTQTSILVSQTAWIYPCKVLLVLSYQGSAYVDPQYYQVKQHAKYGTITQKEQWGGVEKGGVDKIRKRGVGNRGGSS